MDIKKTLHSFGLAACLVFAFAASRHAQAQGFYMATPGSIYVSRRVMPAYEMGYYQTRVRHYYYTSARHVSARAEEDESSAGRAEVCQGGSQPMVRGSRAVVRHGVAYAPSNAPEAVKQAIWATNSIRRKPYKWGGGHGSFSDSGYDCSGTVSFALHHAGVLSSPIPSTELRSYGEHGRGRWITVYSGRGHTFAIIAGLRLDTTGYCGNEGPRWRTDSRETWGFEARHPAGL